MKKSLCLVSMGCLLALAACGEGKTYEAKWSSLDQRPVPQWWVDAKFGIFVCWGLYSVPAYAPTSEAKRHAGYAEWYQERLLAIGKWLEVNGEAIYASRRGTLRGGKRVYTTDGKTARYVIDFNLDGKPFTVGGIQGPVKVELVGSSVPVEFRCECDKLTIKPPALAPAAAPCESAWTYRVTAIGK